MMIKERPRKIANSIALAIEKDIIAGQLNVGEPLATEGELGQRYGASRWAIREAIAIVQNDGLLTMRRGRGGGAVVSSTPGQSLAAAICGFLLYAKFDNSHIVQTRLILDRLLFEAATRDVSRNPSEEALALLASGKNNNSGDTPVKIFEATLSMAGSGITSVMALALAKLTMCRLCLFGVTEKSPILSDVGISLLHLRYTQLESIIGFDAVANFGATERTAQIFYEIFADLESGRALWGQPVHSRAVATRISEILHPGGDARPAGVISTMLMLDAINLPAESRGYIGSEASLMARYGVPRNLLREGIRILERDGFIRTEQGRTGGIKIGEADGSEIIERAIHIFEFMDCPVAEVVAVAREFRMTAMEQVMRDADPAGLAAVATTIRDEIRQSDPMGFFAMLARQTGNNFLMVSEQVCRRLLDQSTPQKPFIGPLYALPDIVKSGNIMLSRRIIAQFHDQFIQPMKS